MVKNNCKCLTSNEFFKRKDNKKQYVYDVINKNYKCTVCKGFISVKQYKQL